MPSLNVASVAFISSASLMFSAWLKLRMCGSVASPTPTMPISSDSTSRMEIGSDLNLCDSAAAVIQPAVPPPRMQMDLMCIGLKRNRACARSASLRHLRADLRRYRLREEDLRRLVHSGEFRLVA